MPSLERNSYSFERCPPFFSYLMVEGVGLIALWVVVVEWTKETQPFIIGIPGIAVYIGH